jgi:Xaa-Pro aminopeptidase
MTMTLTRLEVEAAVERGRDLVATLDPLDVSGRLAQAHAEIAAARKDRDSGYDAILITNLLNIRALTGFTGSAARLLVFPEHSLFITDGRYAERAADELAKANCSAEIAVEVTVRAQNDRIVDTLRVRNIDRLGLEASHVSWADTTKYDELVDAQLVPVNGLVENLRRCKTAAELQRLARGSRIADLAFEEVWPQLAFWPTERDFSELLENAMRTYGADGLSFDTIIASGPNGSRPHHEPGSRTIAHGDLVICDFGALVDGYHSDTTRTVSVGEPSREQKHHLDVVCRTQAAGVAHVAPGVAGVDVDTACREVLKAEGWEDYFTTGLGHGSGLQIHEDPYLGRSSVSILADGDITTVEPGVYIPQVGGVRIEDSMVVTFGGPVLLTCLPYQLTA